MPLLLTATNSPSSAAQQSATQFWSAAAGWTFQRMPSLEVITRLPLPVPATATYSPSSGDQHTDSQLLSAAERTVDQRMPLLPSTAGVPSCSASAATGS